MWTAHGQMRSPSWHMCQCIINILPKWRQKKQEEDVLQRCQAFKDFMILIKSIPYHSFLKQQWSFKPLTRARVRGEQISHWRLGMEWEQVLLLVNQLSVVLFNPLTPTSDQDRISPYNNYRYNIKQISDENKENYQLGDHELIQHQILQTNITRTVLADSWENY